MFIVHGHNVGAREQVARCLEKLELEPIILHEQPSSGLTIIEKFHKFSSVRFAIVLITPDDEGRVRGSSEALRPRARQNVVLELGFFLAKLGREKVCALYSAGVELPSDYAGVVYVPLDENGAWRLALGQELRAAGFDIDLNRL